MGDIGGNAGKDVQANVKDKLVYVSEFVQLICKYNGNKVNISMESGTSALCIDKLVLYTPLCSRL